MSYLTHSRKVWHGICTRKKIQKKTSVQYCKFKNGLYNVDIRERERKRELKMRMIEKVVSDCCGDEVKGYDFCRCCLEHCTPILEYYPDPTDPEYNENWAIPE